MKVACRVFGHSQLLLLLVFSIAGCGGGNDRVTVSGYVTLDGQTLEGAAVTFHNPETGTDASGMTDAEGIYHVRVVPGEYKVGISKVEGEELKKEMTDDEMAIELMKEFELDPRDLNKKKSKQMVAAKFSDVSQTVLTCTVPKGGRDDADFTNVTSK